VSAELQEPFVLALYVGASTMRHRRQSDSTLAPKLS
jgi:hypothetical protein